LRSHRERLGLSADALAKLVGVSTQSIYNWEHGVTRPRQAQLTMLATLRRLGKRDVRTRLERLEGARSAKRAPAAKRARTKTPSKRPARRAKK
jgi:DNA-binding XRE family transcriptional regulator